MNVEESIDLKDLALIIALANVGRKTMARIKGKIKTMKHGGLIPEVMSRAEYGGMANLSGLKGLDGLWNNILVGHYCQTR